MTFLSIGELLDTSAQRTGLSDFGPDDFREGLELLVSCLNAPNAVPEDRQGALRDKFLRLLMNRQWFAKDLSDHPEITEEELLPPVAIISLPRTGTTKLQRILGVTEKFKNPLFWHTMYFARIPGHADHGVKKRIELTRDYERFMLEKVPNFHQGHPMHAEEVEEEYVLTEHSFRCPMLGAVMNLPKYLEWASQSDMTPTYDYLLLQLKYLQWQFFAGDRKPWLLKSPLHMGYEAQLTRIFPQGIKIITPHREPKEMIPSAAYTSYLFQQLWRGKLPLDAEMGRFLLHVFSADVPRFLQWRKDNRSIPILDLRYKDISTDSTKVAQQVFSFLNLPFGEEARSLISAWDKKNPLHKHGKTPASLEMFKLSGDDVDSVFAPYNSMFAEFI